VFLTKVVESVCWNFTNKGKPFVLENIIAAAKLPMMTIAHCSTCYLFDEEVEREGHAVTLYNTINQILGN